MTTSAHQRVPGVEPRWPALLGVIATLGLLLALPDPLTLGPNWLLPASIAVLLAAWMLTHQRESRRVNRALGLSLSALLSLALIWSTGALVAGLPAHRQTAPALLRSAVALWFSNILVFASWYWRLDAGGPHRRDERANHFHGAFLFPQMTQPELGERWKPGFVDYLFLAFNTSTAFSPTDVPVLSRWAKLLMMAQSTLSLGILALLAARAVNIF
jgi:uncharacterized membrane protein